MGPVSNSALAPAGPDRSILLDRRAEGLHVRVRPHFRWVAGWFIAWPVLVFILALELLRRQPTIPYVSPILPGALSSMVLTAIGLLLAAASGVVFVAMSHHLLERGTITADPRGGLVVDLRGVWPRRVRLAAGDVRQIRAVPAGPKVDDRFRNQWQPALALCITPADAAEIKLLEARRPDSLTALASSLTSALGIWREDRARAWRERQSMGEASSPGASPRVLPYSDGDAPGVTLLIEADSVRISLPPHGPRGTPAEIAITGQTLSMSNGPQERSWSCADVHWLAPLDQAMGFGQLMIVLENGTVSLIFNLRPIAELRYVAAVVNGALGLGGGFAGV